ncbi:MAG: SMP-30/Gluconolaconase/LRE-like region [Nocardioides sp.]|nr:SMP-30/Gluconolaconase/LRE-like region [Nocardioides sp.]
MRRSLAAAVALALLTVGLAAPTAPAAGTVASAAAAEPSFRTTVFSLVPAPGRPAYVHASRSGRVYAGSYVSGDAQRSRVFEWSRSGTLLRSWTVPGQRLDGNQGVQVANETRNGLLVLLETSTRRLLTLDVTTGRFRRIATFPRGAVPNYATWGPRHLFVTDYANGVVYRVFQSGRVERWFRSPALVGAAGFGTTGIVYRPRQRDLLITQQTVTDGSGLPTNGALYSLPLDRGRHGTLRTLWRSLPTDLPDGFGIGRSGRIYVANAGLTAQLVQLSPTGRELRRFPEEPFTGDNGSPVPFDTPCSATFLGTRVLVANQSAIQGDPAHQAILSVEVGERGVTPFIPTSAFYPR